MLLASVKTRTVFCLCTTKRKYLSCGSFKMTMYPIGFISTNNNTRVQYHTYYRYDTHARTQTHTRTHARTHARTRIHIHRVTHEDVLQANIIKGTHTVYVHVRKHCSWLCNPRRTHQDEHSLCTRRKRTRKIKRKIAKSEYYQKT